MCFSFVAGAEVAARSRTLSLSFGTGRKLSPTFTPQALVVKLSAVTDSERALIAFPWPETSAFSLSLSEMLSL